MIRSMLQSRPTLLHQRAGPRWLAFLALLLPGCAQLTYDRVPIGARPGEYRERLPAETSRTTAAGRSCLMSDAAGGTDAIVLLLNSERRVAGKLWAAESGPDDRMRGQPAFRLTGEIDRALYNVPEVAPPDVLRLVRTELLAACASGPSPHSVSAEPLVRGSHARIAVGIERLLAGLPQPVSAEVLASDAGANIAEAVDMRTRIPEGGAAELREDAGRIILSYEVR
jgi:hypothetical protein